MEGLNASVFDERLNKSSDESSSSSKKSNDNEEQDEEQHQRDMKKVRDTWGRMDLGRSRTNRHSMVKLSEGDLQRLKFIAHA